MRRTNLAPRTAGPDPTTVDQGTGLLPESALAPESAPKNALGRLVPEATVLVKTVLVAEATPLVPKSPVKLAKGPDLCLRCSP
jgi:hypothetical protein